MATGTKRFTAEERREQVVDAAIEEFAQAGLAGASTEAIARRAGISHAYLFRLFGTKRELFVTAVDEALGRILRAFQEAEAARAPEVPAFAALGASYVRLIEDRRELLFCFHAYAACGDEDIRERVRARYEELFAYVARVSGGDRDAVRLFMATGALLAIGAAIGWPELAGDGSWMAGFLAPR
ncbi:MAG: TetR/AcrR family transcriptional regulator [Actinomycetota bacterium]|nr:TetR/AcrR family transcriptional regulator [Actinomycetota bacterium]